MFEGGGRISEYLGGYREWTVQRSLHETKRASREKREAGAAERATHIKAQHRGAKLSYKEQRELESLPAHIEALETEQSQLQNLILSADFYRRDKHEITQTLERVEGLKQELDEAYSRWEALDSAIS